MAGERGSRGDLDGVAVRIANDGLADVLDAHGSAD
jgi:hypothetical protein